MDHICAGFLVWALSGSAMAGALSLDALPGLVERQNSQVQRAAADEAVAKADQAVAHADFMPNLTLKATQSRTDEAIVLDVPALPIGIDPPPLTIQDRDVSKAQLQLIQPIYFGGRLSAQQDVRDAEVGIKTAELAQERSQQLGIVLQRYFQTQYAAELLSVLKKFKTHLEKIDQLTKGLIENGAIPRYMRRKTETALAELQAKLVQAEAQEKVLCQATQSLLGAQGECQFKSQLRLLPMPASAGSLQGLAHEQRAEWKILQHNAEKAEAMHDAATGSLLPSVYAFGRYELLQEQLTLLEPKWVIGLGLEWTLTAGLKAIPERHKADALRQKVAINRSQAERDIPLQIQQYWAQAAGELAALKATDQGLTGARETLQISELRYSTGDGSQFEVLNAYSDVEKLSIKRLELLESYNRYLISLFIATGDANLYIQHYAKPI